MSSQASYLQAHSVLLYRASNRSNAGKRLWHDLSPLSHSGIWQAYSCLLSSPCAQQQGLLRSCGIGSSILAHTLGSVHADAHVHRLCGYALPSRCLTCNLLGIAAACRHLLLCTASGPDSMTAAVLQ